MVEVFDPTSTRVYLLSLAESESESYVTTDGQPASLSWNKAASGLVLYSRARTTQKTVLLLRSADHTEKKSHDSQLASPLAC
jgi:hypothetical protein